MKITYKVLPFLSFGAVSTSLYADNFIDFNPVVKVRPCTIPGFMNAYCDTNAIVLYETDTIHISFYLDQDFPATDDEEFNSNLKGLTGYNPSYDELDMDAVYNNLSIIGDSIVSKVTSYNDSTLSIQVEEYNKRDSDWRTRRYELVNFDKRTKSRFYKDLKDSILMWSKSGYDGEDYTISDYLITVQHYEPEVYSGSAAGCGKHTKTTIVDRETWEAIKPNEIVWCDQTETYVDACHNSLLEFLMTLKLSEDWGCAFGDSTTDTRFDVSKCHETHWYIGNDDYGRASIGAYEDGVTIYLERCPGYRWYEAPVHFTYDEIFDFLIPGTAVYETAQKYIKNHELKGFHLDTTRNIVGIKDAFDDVFIQTTDISGYYIKLPNSLQKSKKLRKTWCWVDPKYRDRHDEKYQRGKDVVIPKKIKYKGFRYVSDNGDAEISVRIFTNLAKAYRELIPTLTTSTDCQNPDFHEYDIPGETLSKQFIFRGIDKDSKDLIEYDIRCLPGRAYYYKVASYMMFNVKLDDYNQHYEFTLSPDGFPDSMRVIR